ERRQQKERDFFAQRVTDDPQPSQQLYDPQQDRRTVVTPQNTGAPAQQPAGAPAPQTNTSADTSTATQWTLLEAQDKDKAKGKTSDKDKGKVVPPPDKDKDKKKAFEREAPKVTPSEAIPAPRGPVEAEALPDAGVLVLRGLPEDIAAMLKVIEILQRQA